MPMSRFTPASRSGAGSSCTAAALLDPMDSAMSVMRRGHFKIQQTGTVIVEDDVEIGANSCIDRGTFGATVIGAGSKLDNLVHVGHNCRIGKHTIIVGCVGISGSVEIGERCVIAGQAGVSHHIKIGDNATIMQKTAVTKDVPPGGVVSGLHCRDHREQLRVEALDPAFTGVLPRVGGASKTNSKAGPMRRSGREGTRVFDVQEILGFLPHRYPFLLVDRIIEYEPGKRIVGLKKRDHQRTLFPGTLSRGPNHARRYDRGVHGPGGRVSCIRRPGKPGREAGVLYRYRERQVSEAGTTRRSAPGGDGGRPG